MTIQVDLENAVIVVAGVGPGLGSSLCEHLVDNCNARVVALSKDVQSLQRLSEKYESTEKVFVEEVDLCEDGHVERIFTQLQTQYPNQVRGLVHTAFVAERFPNYLEITKNEFDRVMHNNLYSALAISREAIRMMLKNTPDLVFGTPVRGNIVFVGSIVDDQGDLAKVLYGPAKAGLGSLTRTISCHYGSQGIIPFHFRTGTFRKAIEGEVGKAYYGNELTVARKAAYTQKSSLRRNSTPQEIATLVARWIDPSCAFHCGSDITADGGYEKNLRNWGRFDEQIPGSDYDPLRSVSLK